MESRNPSSSLTADEAARLLEAARSFRDRAYAPYSRFQVGAAILDSAGGVHPGVNVENASFGLTMCAERSALFRAVTEGAEELIAIAVVGPEDQAALTPCGSCRQVLWELAPDILVVMAPAAEPRIKRLADLLPDAFDSRSLSRTKPY